MLFGGEGRRPLPDVAAYAADKRLVAEPGTAFCYSSGTSNIVSSIVRDVVDDYAGWLRARLFDPIGMASARPRFDGAGTWIGSSYCFCTARDFAAFGQLYMDGGRGVLAPEWVATSRRVTASAAETLDNPHTMHWWAFAPVAPIEAFHASGYEGQYTIVVPELDLVVVRLGQTVDTDRVDVARLLAELIASYA